MKSIVCLLFAAGFGALSPSPRGTERVHRDPAHRWLREQLLASV